MHKNVARYWAFKDAQMQLYRDLMDRKKIPDMYYRFECLISEAEAMNLKSTQAQLIRYRDHYYPKEEK